MRIIYDECKKINKPFKTLPSLSELIEGKVSLSQLRDISLTDLLGRKEISFDKTLINKLIKGKRVLVTGAGGSIGLNCKAMFKISALRYSFIRY